MTSQRFTVSITARAERDLHRIAHYYAESDALDAALEMIDAIRAKVATLEEFPERRAIPDEVRSLGIEDLRQLLVPPFRVFYLIDADTVSVMMVADGRRDIVSLLQQRMVDP